MNMHATGLLGILRKWPGLSTNTLLRDFPGLSERGCALVERLIFIFIFIIFILDFLVKS